jgi:hypothetical protein
MPTQKPRWTSAAVVRAAEQIHPLAVKHRALLEPRLSAGFIDGIKADADAVRAASDAAADARGTTRSATISQNEALDLGAKLVSRIRALVRTGQPTNKALWRDIGVGTRTNGSVARVTAALTQVLNAANRFPAELRAAGVLPGDLDEARAALSALVAADSSQEGKKVSSRQATQALNATRVRLENNLMHLASVAAASLPAADARLFADALPRTGRGTPKRASPAPAAPPTP